VNQQTFESSYGRRWDECGQWLATSNAARKAATGNDLESFDMPARYRELCQHLALARDRQYSADLIERLSRLALGGHQVLYGARDGGVGRMRTFLRAGFPRAVRREWRFVWLAIALFMGPLIALTFAIPRYPEFAYVVLPADTIDSAREMYGADSKALGRKRDADTDVAMFGFYIFNNVRIGFQTFASGLLFGVGALFYLLFNGLFIGAFTGYIVDAGLAAHFFSFTAGHSAFELTAICLSGAAGLKLGYALIAPGRLTRSAALRAAAADAIPIMIGAAGMLFIAAAIEAFWSPRTFLVPLAKYAIGIALWLLLTAYFLFAGRSHGS